MGSPFSPILCDLVLQCLETKCLKMLPFEVPLYFRYVDDTLICIPNDMIEFTLNIFNSFDNNIQFTSEKCINNKINFLDVELIIQDNNSVITNWYRKPSFSGRYLNFNSHHPLTHKIGIVYTLVDYSIKLSHSTFHNKNLELIKILLTQNNYPSKFIDKYINIRLKKHLHDNNFTNPTKKINSNNPMIVLPYMKNIAYQINKICSKSQISVIYSCINKFSLFIKLGKDITTAMNKRDVVYKISCSGCSSVYIGQTSRKLKTRCDEHKRDCKNKNERSALVQHMKDTSHSFNIEKTKILDIEYNLKKRLFSEMLYIHSYSNNINRQLDTQMLKNCYKNLINKISKVDNI